MEKKGRPRITELDCRIITDQTTLPAPEITQRFDSLFLA